MPTPSFYINPYRLKTSKLYAQIPANGAGDLTVTRATTATRTNNQGILEVVGNNVPRIDFTNPNAPGVLIEPDATNQIRNNTMVGAVVGTPGTLPTNWGVVFASGLSHQIVGVGIENGIQYIDLRIFGTATGNFLLAFNGASIISATSSQTWTHSAFLQVIAAPTPPTNYQLGAIYTNAGAYVNETQVNVFPTGTLQRLSATITTTSSTINSLYPTFRVRLSNGQPCDFTIRIGWPQMELGSVATSPIPTSGTIQTRNADVISLTGASALIGQTQGTIYAEVDLKINKTSFCNLIGIRDPLTANADIRCFQRGLDGGASANRVAVQVRVNNVIANFNAETTAVSAGVHKLAFSYQQSNYSFYFDGIQVATSTDATALSWNLSDIFIGSSQAGTNPINDRIRAAALYTTRLSNDELQKLTTL